jgi:F-box and WD-40 domain protein CDC4
VRAVATVRGFANSRSVTHVTRTTTSFAPITLPRIPSPETLSMPSHLSAEQYPLAHEPSPGDMRFFAMNLGGRRVICQEEGASAEESAGEMKGPGWTRVIPSGAAVRDDSEKIDLAQALRRAKGKEVRKRPHTHSRVASHNESREARTPPLTGEGKVRARSPPRKRVRGLEDLTISLDGTAAPLSPLPSPDHEGSTAPPGLLAPASAAPSIGSGMELSALFSLPAIVNHFDTLPDKLQQHVLMHLFRRSRLPTIQRLSTFISTALKRDFISLLPAEIAVQILRKVDTRSLAQASRVNRRWRKMIDSERSVWRQRLIDDDLWVGLGTEEEEEQLVKRRFDALDWKRSQPSKASTPSEDEYMDWSGGSRPAAVEIERPVPLKHVYRRRYASERNWLNKGPTHHSFPGHGTNVVTCTQFDRDKIVTASDDHSINVYDMKTGALRKRLDGHEGGVWALEYYGDTLVTGSTDRTIRVWDLETMQETHVFHGHTSTVRCLQIIVPVYDEKTGEYQPPYPMFVTGSRDASIRLWKLPKKGEPSYTSPVSAMRSVVCR